MSRVALIQLVSGEDVAANLCQLEALLAEAAAQGAQLAVLPENFALFDSAALRPLAEQEAAEGGVQAWLARQAKTHDLWLVAGSLPLARRGDGTPVAGGRIRSACLVLDNEGRVRARYDKVHLFDVEVDDGQGAYRESAYVEPGSELVVVDTPCGRLGLTICYDLRFAEQFARLRQAGAELISVPSAFTHVTGAAHWELLLRARAVETQCFLLGVNQGGRHSNKRETWGHSMVVDPWGEVSGSLAFGAGVLVVETDRQRLAEVRRRMPVLLHRQAAGY